MPRCCVVVPALRPEGTLAALARLDPAVTEAVVIDNSGGAVAEAVAREAPWAVVLRPGSNLGFGAAVHMGILATDADVVIPLNDDVVPGPGFTEGLTAVFADPDVVHAAGVLVKRVNGRLDSVGLSFDRTLRAENIVRLVEGRPAEALIGPSGAAAAYRRTTYLAIGGFAPELFAYWEDADLALRFWAAGFDCTFVPGAVAEHRRGTALSGRSPDQRLLDAYGRGFVLGRYAGWLTKVDRLAVLLTDWPSLGRSTVIVRSRSVLAARARGKAAGRRAVLAPVERTDLAGRRVSTTLLGQVAGFFGRSRAQALVPAYATGTREPAVTERHTTR